MKTILHLCYSHFIKLIAKLSSKKNNHKLHEIAIYCCSAAVCCLKQSSQYMCEHVPLYRLGSYINGLKWILSSRMTILQVAHCFVVVVDVVRVGVMIDARLMSCSFVVCRLFFNELDVFIFVITRLFSAMLWCIWCLWCVFVWAHYLMFDAFGNRQACH